jgi:hypothetical protein
MPLTDLLRIFDAALEWQDDDPFLDDHEPPGVQPATPWTPGPASD